MSELDITLVNECIDPVFLQTIKREGVTLYEVFEGEGLPSIF